MAGKTEVKPGYQSTEFYITVLAGIISAYLAKEGIIINEQALIGVALPIVAYILSRGWVKAKNN